MSSFGGSPLMSPPPGYIRHLPSMSPPGLSADREPMSRPRGRTGRESQAPGLNLGRALPAASPAPTVNSAPPCLCFLPGVLCGLDQRSAGDLPGVQRISVKRGCCDLRSLLPAEYRRPRRMRNLVYRLSLEFCEGSVSVVLVLQPGKLRLAEVPGPR